MRKIFICLLGGLLTSPMASLAQTGPRIWVEYDTSGMIGDAMNLRLRCESPNPENVNFPLLKEQLSTDLLLIPTDSLKVDTSFNTESGLKAKTVSYLFSSYQEGLYTMPSFCFEYPAGDSTFTYCTDTGHVRFYAPEVDTTAAIKDIAPAFSVSNKELIKEYWAKYDIFLWIALAAALLCGAIVFIYKKWKRKEPLFAQKKPAVPPVIRALESLNRLKERELWQNNLIKDYYTELTDILRLYLSEAMDIPAVEMTNEELRLALKKHFPAKSQDARNLIEVLDTATLVKFAKVLPGATEHENCYAVVKGFLEAQKKEQEEAKAAENAKNPDNADTSTESSPKEQKSEPDPIEPHLDSPCTQTNDNVLTRNKVASESKEEKEAPTGN